VRRVGKAAGGEKSMHDGKLIRGGRGKWLARCLLASILLLTESEVSSLGLVGKGFDKGMNCELRDLINQTGTGSSGPGCFLFRGEERILRGGTGRRRKIQRNLYLINSLDV